MGEDLGAGDEHRGEGRDERDHTDGDAAEGLRLIGIQVMVAVGVWGRPRSVDRDELGRSQVWTKRDRVAEKRVAVVALSSRSLGLTNGAERLEESLVLGDRATDIAGVRQRRCKAAVGSEVAGVHPHGRPERGDR